jgi:hypothetical protein
VTAEGFTGGDPAKLNRTGYSKGQVVAANAAGALTALPIDIDGKVLTLDSPAVLGVDWQPGGGGGGGVNSVFGRFGNVTAQAADYTVGQITGAAPTASPTFTGTATFAKSVSTPVALSAAAANIATDASQGNAFRVTLVGNGPYTLKAPTNPTDGQMAIWEIAQDNVGSRALTLETGVAGGFAFGTDLTSITLTTTASKTDILGARYNAAAQRWWVIAFVKGY